MMSAAPDDSLSEVIRLLGEKSGFEPETLGRQAIEHAVRNQMAATGAASVQEFGQRLLADPSAIEQLLEDVVVPETWFFRDALAFRDLAERLAERRWSSSGPVRVLSIACSTGEEVYSLAMALGEAGLKPPQYSILGVDVARRAIQAGQAGRYSARSFRDSSQTATAWRDRWFDRVGDAWQIREALRAGVEFRWANLSQSNFLAGEPAFHVIFCRNVLIYFHVEARRTAVANVRRLLRPNGLVWSAPAEASIFANAGFRGLGSDCPYAFAGPASDSDLSPPTPGKRPRPDVLSPLSNAGARPAASAPPLARVGREAGGEGTLVLPAPSRSVAAVERRTAEPAAGAPAGNAAPALDRERTDLQAAQEAADRGRLDEAERICGRILAENVSCADAHYLRGVVWQAQGKLREAQRSLEKALYLNPRHHRSLVHMMLLAQERGDLLAAANFRRRVEKADPGETE